MNKGTLPGAHRSTFIAAILFLVCFTCTGLAYADEPTSNGSESYVTLHTISPAETANSEEAEENAPNDAQYISLLDGNSKAGEPETETHLEEEEVVNKEVSIKDAVITGISNKTYNGKAQTQKIVVKLTLGEEERTLVSGVDYGITYKNNVNAGTATVVISGKGNYVDSVSKTFKIKPASIGGASISGLANKTWNGKAQTQNPTVKFSGKALKKGTDYTVSFKNNKAVGKATVVVTGKGNFTGSKSATFKIVGKTPHVYYKSHRQSAGWEKQWKYDGQSSAAATSKRLEAFYMKVDGGGVTGSIQYRSLVQGQGWQAWKNQNKVSGTTGKARRIEAVQIRLTGNMAKEYDVYYRAYVQYVGWMGWAKNGASAGSGGFGMRVERLQVKLVAKGKKAPGSTAGAYVSAAKPGSVSVLQQKIVKASAKTPRTGSGRCAAWVSRVSVRAGLKYPGGNANDMWKRWCKSTKLSELKPGMAVAVQKSPTRLGRKYGHIGIYIGNGLVRHNVGSGVRTMPLGQWLDTFNYSKNAAWGNIR